MVILQNSRNQVLYGNKDAVRNKGRAETVNEKEEEKEEIRREF